MYKDERWVQQERNMLISLLQDAQNNQKIYTKTVT